MITDECSMFNADASDSFRKYKKVKRYSCVSESLAFSYTNTHPQLHTYTSPKPSKYTENSASLYIDKIRKVHIDWRSLELEHDIDSTIYLYENIFGNCITVAASVHTHLDYPL